MCKNYKPNKSLLIMDREATIKELISNKDYQENLEEILDKYFEQNPNCLDEWLAWFNGK